MQLTVFCLQVTSGHVTTVKRNNLFKKMAFLLQTIRITHVYAQPRMMSYPQKVIIKPRYSIYYIYEKAKNDGTMVTFQSLSALFSSNPCP